MGRFRHGVPLAVLLSLALLYEGCGGSYSSPPPPPPVAHFILKLSSSSTSPPRRGYGRPSWIPRSLQHFRERHPRHTRYDSATKQVFVAKRAMNRVEVFAPPSQSRTAQFPVPGATTLHPSADGTAIWIGTAI